jgi:hypothetical protein
VRSYISLFGKEYDRLPLVKVIVGPSKTQDANAALAREILNNNKIPVLKSATPFIG